ncbi:MAG: diguanylate cyclase [Candidatus Levyibacteriota bacterium]
MLKKPFYDPLKSYEENYDKGPFSSFADGIKLEDPIKTTSYEFLGQKVNLPFGIPAGPLLNSKFVKAAFEKGFDIPVYKTVRAGIFPCHPNPNVLAVHVDGDLTMERAKNPLIADTNYDDPISITNSFGVPSKDPSIWQEDAKKAMSYAGEGQVMVLSFMGTVRPDQTAEEFVADFALSAKLAHETGAKILEANLSCPNIGNEGLVCYNLEMTKKVAEAIRKEIDNTPLILKVGYYQNDEDLEKLAKIVNESANSVSAINTIAAPIVDRDGNQALPGSPMRLKSGVCGACIKWAGLDTVKRLKKIREEKGYKFSIEGVGGVTKPEDFFEYQKAGADAVFSATGAMWNPELAIEIKEKIARAQNVIANAQVV